MNLLQNIGKPGKLLGFPGILGFTGFLDFTFHLFICFTVYFTSFQGFTGFVFAGILLITFPGSTAAH